MKTISRVRKGALQDTVIWTRADQTKTLLWVIKDRRLVRRLLELSGNKPWDKVFSLGRSMCFELPYEPERPVERFAVLRKSHPEQKDLWIQIVSVCMVGGLPYGILYLLLKERKLQISREGKLYFYYDLDLADLPRKATEEDCADMCAEVLLNLMKKRRWEKESSIALLVRKKKKRGMYKSFTQLYRDIHMYEPEPAFYVIWAAKAKNLLLYQEEIKQKLFPIALWLAAVVIVTAAVLFISRAITGDTPFSFLFWGAIEQIGTEPMIQ